MECSSENSRRKDGLAFFAADNGGAELLKGSAVDGRDSSTCSGRPSSDVSTDKSKETDMMEERFAKLLLGEDMSGSGKGVCTALAISNAITNLCATVYGQLWRLEPLPSEKKSMWQREMEWLLCVSDHIVELIPSWQRFPDGSKIEIMTCRPRSDLFINLPALRKLDNMLLEILDSFSNTEFWYVDRGIVTLDANGTASFSESIQLQEKKWWLPVPRFPSGGLHEDTRKQLDHKREYVYQILKASIAINNAALAEMEVPESYLEGLPKNGRACLGDAIYRFITSDRFLSECLLDCIDMSSKHGALDIANRVEASIHVWRRRSHSKPMTNSNRSAVKSPWEIVKDMMLDIDNRSVLLAERAESLLLCLKQRFPGLAQTTLDTCKIKCNKDIGKSILESYSRVLESLAVNILARIDDLLYVDNLTRHSDKLSSVPTFRVIPHKRVPITHSVPVSGTTPYKSPPSSLKFAHAPLVSPASGERVPFASVNSSKLPRRRLGVERVLTSNHGGQGKVKSCGNSTEGLGLVPSKHSAVAVSQKEPSALKIGSRLQQIDAHESVAWH